MAAQVQTSLFEVSPYITGKKRVRYKIPTYQKEYEDFSGESLKINNSFEYASDYQKLDDLYSKIYNYCGIEILNTNSENDKVRIIDGLKIWTIKYDKNPYEYEGTTYEGQKFTVRAAEIIGTEDWDIKKRIEIHERFLQLLRKDFSIEESLERIKYGKG
jgi:hypothetical protein